MFFSRRRVSSHRQPSLTDWRTDRTRLGWRTFQLAIVVAVLGVGATRALVLDVVVVGLASACLLVWWDVDTLRLRRGAIVILAVGVLLTVFTAFQCVPLPIRWVTALSPHAADIWQRALMTLQEQGPAVVPLSLDPSATRVEVLRATAYVLTFMIIVVSRHRHEIAIQRLLVGLGVFVIVVAAVHYACDLRKVYGIYAPRTAVTTVAPFLNANHLSAFGNVALILAYSALLGNVRLAPPALLLVTVIICAAADAFWASRAAIASALVGVALVTAFALRTRASNARRLVIPVSAAIVAVGLLVLALAPTSLSSLVGKDMSKLEITARVFGEMVPRYWLFGTGRGAFESTFPEFRQGVGFVVWTHPENVVAEWTSGWGVPTTVGLVGAMCYALRPRAIVTGRAIGPWVVLVVIGLHNLVDFSLEIPAMGIAVVACAALVLRGRSMSGPQQTRIRKPRRLAYLAVLAALGAIVLCSMRRNDLLDDRERVEAALREHRTLTGTKQLLREAMSAHPAEPYFPYARAILAARDHDSDVLLWIERTLERAPVYPPAHAVLARWLRRSAPAQSRLEYRLFAEQMEDGSVLKPAEVEGLVSDFDDALELTPRGRLGVTFLDALAVRIAKRLPATAFRLDEEIVARKPGAVEPMLRAATSSLGDLNEPWCDDRAPCVARIVELARRVQNAHPDICDGFIVEADAKAHEQTTAALAVLVQAASQVTDRAPCDDARARLAISAGARVEAQEAIASLSNAPCSGARCVDNLLRAAELEKSFGAGNRALVYVRRALLAAPGDDNIVERAALLASAAGFHAEAAGYYRQLVVRHPDMTSRLSQEERAIYSDTPGNP